MKKLIIEPILIILLLPFASCGTTTTGSGVEKETPPMTVEEGKELTIESWQIGENWMYSQQSIWGDIMVGLETERQQGKVVKQYIATYNLRSREKELVYELPVDRQVYDAPAIDGNRVVWASVDRDEAEQQRSLRRAPMPNYDVFLLDLDTGEVQQLTVEEHAQVYPRIYGDTIVWLDNRHEEGYHNPRRYDVYAYDLKSKSERRLTLSTSVEEGNMKTALSGRMPESVREIPAATPSLTAGRDRPISIFTTWRPVRKRNSPLPCRGRSYTTPSYTVTLLSMCGSA